MSFVTTYNEGIRNHAEAMVGGSKQHILSMGVKKSGAFFRSVKKYIKYEDNEAERISITALRHGFIQQTQGGIGSTVSMNGSRRKLTGGRPRLTIRQGVDEQMESLGDFVASMFADKAVDHVNLGVKVRG